jgi:hypothetical protein
LYGQKQAGRVWNQHLHAGLAEKLGFVQSEADPCIYYRGTLIFLLYTDDSISDDSILIFPDDSEIDKAIEELSKHFNTTDQGQIDDYLGVKVKHRANGSIKLSQLHLIDSILNNLKFREEVKTKEMPVPSMVILNKDEDGEDFDESFHY